MSDILVQRIIGIAGMCLWLVFPIGMAISLWRQDRSAMPASKGQPANFHLGTSTHQQYSANEEFDDYEDPIKIDDFGHQHVSIDPGPDHQHTNLQ